MGALMRKIDPEGVWQDFADQLEQQAAFYSNSWDNMRDGNSRRIATENYVLTIGVMFEGFVNDLIFAYANRDCSKVMSHLEESVRSSLKEKALTAFEMFGEFKKRDHLSRDELKNIFDPQGRNTSFPNFAAILERARKWLVDEHNDKFNSLTATQRAVIDATIAARNNLAHRSKSSLDRLNEAFDAGALHATGLRRNVNRIQQAGHYLKTMCPGDQTRADILGNLLEDASRQLAAPDE